MYTRPHDRKDHCDRRQPNQPANLSDALAAFLLALLTFAAEPHATADPC
jgi:hypothetical protein